MDRCALVLVLASLASVLVGGCRGCDAGDQPGDRPGVGAATSGAVALQRIARRERQRADPDRWVTAQLRHPNARVRARAALALGRMDHPAALQSLTVVLSDRDATVRRQAAFALRLHVLDSSARPAVAPARAAVHAALELETDSDARRMLLSTLGWLGDSRDHPLLRRALAGPNAVAAVTAWGMLARLPFESAAQTQTTQTQTAQTQLAQTREAQANDALSQPLAAPQTALRRAAAWAAAQQPREALSPELARQLRRCAAEDSDEWVRLWCMRAVGRSWQLTQLRWLLRRASRESSPRVQVEILRGLARGSTAAAVRLARTVAELWGRAAASHQRLVGAELRPVLVGLRELERHADVPSVRKVMGELLELADVGGATVDYGPLERHSIDLVHCAAARVWDLGTGRVERTPTCGTARSKALSSAWRRQQVVDVIAAMKRDARWKLTLLRRYLRDPAVAVRARAVESLSRVNDAMVAPAIGQALGDAAWPVFGAAARVIAYGAKQLHSEDLVVALRQRAERLDIRFRPETAAVAAGALGALGVREALPLLHRWARGQAWAVRRPARQAIAALGRAPSTLDGTAPALSLLPRPGPAKLPTRAVLVTARGEVELQLLPSLAPLAVSRFAQLAQDRRYRGERIRRVEANAFIETGSAAADARAPLARLPCELSPTPVDRGAVAFAVGGRDTAAKQFAISLARQRLKDGRVTVFARVVKGMDVVDRLQPGDRIKDLYIPLAQKTRSGTPR